MRGQVLLDQREIVKQLPDYVYEVSPSFVDNPNLRQFSTISAANDHALANMPPWPVKVSILVYPGNYIESIENAHYRVHIMGMADSSYYLKGVTLYNTGEDADHYPIKYTGTSQLNLLNMTIEVAPGKVYGNFASLRCVNCAFLEGHFNEYMGSGARTMEFSDCYFDAKAFELSGVTGDRFLALRGCELDTGPMTLGSTSPSGERKFVKVERGISECDINIGGDWSIGVYNSEMYGNGKFIFDTTADVTFDGVLLPNGVHFKSNPVGTKRFIGCNFINPAIASTHRDVSADVTITDVDYSGNAQQWGICDCIRIRNPEKHVGPHDDRYYDLQSAISSITNGGTVRLWENLVDLPEITLPNANIDMSIDGQKKYSLDFTGDIIEIGANRKVSFVDLVKIDGGNVQLNGTNAEVGFESCQYVIGYLTLTLGTFAIIYKSSFFGSTGKKAVNFDNVNTILVVGYSRIQGSLGNEAIIFNVDADNKLKAKYSSIIHGSGGSNSPIHYIGAGKVDFQMYNCGLNASWNPASLNNTIGSANNTFDPGITF